MVARLASLADCGRRVGVQPERSHSKSQVIFFTDEYQAGMLRH